jgi:hypothetical protein
MALLGRLTATSPGGETPWIVLLRDDAGKVLDLRTLTRRSDNVDPDDVIADTEDLLTAAGYRFRRDPMVTPGWFATWAIGDESDTIDGEPLTFEVQSGA